MKKNNYLISPNYLLQLENDELRERIKQLIADYKELKKMYDIQEAERMGKQTERNNAITQE